MRIPVNVSEARALLEGIGPDAAIVTNAAGGKSSAAVARLDLVPPLSLLEIGRILDYGAQRYGVGNWKKIEWQDHFNHALIHAFALLAGDTQDDHMGHFACRAMMAHESYLLQAHKGKKG